jgi:hypothetical protein
MVVDAPAICAAAPVGAPASASAGLPAFDRVVVEQASDLLRVVDDRGERPAPVLCLTILDVRRPDPRILVGVRSPLVNATHPNVVSTPTIRIPPGSAADLLDGAGFRPASPDGHRLWLSGARSTNGARRGSSLGTGSWEGGGDHDPLIHETTSLMAKKLGLADALAVDRFLFSVEPVSAVLGAANYANLGCTEFIVMTNLLVRVLDGADLVPASTVEYDPLVWVDVARFLVAVEERDPFAILPDGDPFELCVHGLCVSSAALFLRHRPDVWRAA